MYFLGSEKTRLRICSEDQSVSEYLDNEREYNMAGGCVP